jgi:hypothetical protein
MGWKISPPQPMWCMGLKVIIVIVYNNYHSYTLSSNTHDAGEAESEEISTATNVVYGMRDTAGNDGSDIPTTANEVYGIKGDVMLLLTHFSHMQ